MAIHDVDEASSHPSSVLVVTLVTFATSQLYLTENTRSQFMRNSSLFVFLVFERGLLPGSCSTERMRI